MVKFVNFLEFTAYNSKFCWLVILTAVIGHEINALCKFCWINIIHCICDLTFMKEKVVFLDQDVMLYITESCPGYGIRGRCFDGCNVYRMYRKIQGTLHI